MQLEDQALGLNQSTISHRTHITCQQAVWEAPVIYVFKGGLDTFMLNRATKSE